jgi:membrane protease YdiL (CAAX protease family)
VLGSFSAFFVVAMIAAAGGPELGATAVAFGIAIGYGGVGTIAARAVPPPQPERIGLRRFRLRFLLPILLAVPITLLGSELNNVASAWFPAPDAEAIQQRVEERLRTDEWLAAVQSVILVVGIAPVVEEFFFRGVVQQGLVARFGVGRGVVLTALLFGLGHGNPEISAAASFAAAVSTFLYGIVFGLLRVWSGSVLASTLLHAGVNGAGLLATTYADRLPIPGFNAAGAHTPALVLAAAAASVALSLWLAWRAGHLEPPPAAPLAAREPGPAERD